MKEDDITDSCIIFEFIMLPIDAANLFEQWQRLGSRSRGLGGADPSILKFPNIINSSYTPSRTSSYGRKSSVLSPVRHLV